MSNYKQLLAADDDSQKQSTMKIDKEKSILVVVDIQERLFLHIHEHTQLENNCKLLISGVSILNVPVLVTEQYSKGLGSTISTIKEVIPDYNPLEKISFSCCGNTGFLNSLHASGKTHVIICGIEAHVCVLQTALDLKISGFQPFLVADCTGSRKPHDKKYAIERLRDAGIIITSSESVLFELCRVAGTGQFKRILKLLK